MIVNTGVSPWANEPVAATKGTISELRVTLDLLTKGFHVFLPCSPASPCDLIALKNTKLIKIQVRSAGNASTFYSDKRDDKSNIDCYAFVMEDAIAYTTNLNEV